MKFNLKTPISLKFYSYLLGLNSLLASQFYLGKIIWAELKFTNSLLVGRPNFAWVRIAGPGLNFQFTSSNREGNALRGSWGCKNLYFTCIKEEATTVKSQENKHQKLYGRRLLLLLYKFRQFFRFYPPSSLKFSSYTYPSSPFPSLLRYVVIFTL